MPEPLLPEAVGVTLRSAAAHGLEIDEGGRAVGSNNWAVGEHVGVGGRAIVVGDMHLSLTVPNIWYSVRMIVGADASDPLDII